MIHPTRRSPGRDKAHGGNGRATGLASRVRLAVCACSCPDGSGPLAVHVGLHTTTVARYPCGQHLEFPMADTENKRRTITLTDRPPVIISDDKWPLIASASDKEFDNQYEFQANRISKWFVGVRQHEDGRTIVYATYSYSSNWQNSRDYSAKRGVMLDSFALREASDSADIVRAVREVTEDIAGA